MVGPKNAVWAEESAEVEVLYANLAKLKALTKKIQGSITRLEVSGEVVQEAIGPIYSNTQQLQTTNRNIDRVNEAIERLRQPLDAKGREEGIIRAGPQASGLPQYIGAIRRVDKALSDLTSSNLRSNQQAISDFDGLLLSGISQLRELFRQSLSDGNAPVEPLHYITKQLTFPTFPPEKQSHLNQIASAIASTSSQSSRYGMQDEDDTVRAYAEIRGQYLASSLENLATASINTSKRRTMDTGIYRQGTSGVGAYASGIEGMCLAEYENISKIFRGEQIGRAVEQTCQPTITKFASTLKELNGVIRARIMNDCFLSYEIIELVTPMSYRLETRTGQLRPQFSDALRPVRESARSSLTELIDQTKARANGISTLPPDGNTIPLVPETCSRLQALANYDRPLASMLSSIGDGGWRTAQAKAASNTSLPLQITPSADNPSLLSHYLLDLIDALLTTLDSRSRPGNPSGPAGLHRSKSLQGIFLLNSVTLLQRSIASSADLSRYLAISPFNEKLIMWHKRASSLYLEAWRDPSAHLLDTIRTTTSTSATSNRPVSGGTVESANIVKNLSSKDKDKIKEKFKNFNISFDDLLARHRSLYMEKEVRAHLGKEIQAMIEPLYARFWDRYHDVDKGKGKVVKYDKGQLAGLLASLS